MIFLPAAAILAGGALVGGAAVAGIRVAADAYVNRQLEREAAAARVNAAAQRYRALAERVAAARRRYGDGVTPLPEPPAVRARMDPGQAAELELAIGTALDQGLRRFQAEFAAATTAQLTAALSGAAAHVAGLPRTPAGPAPELVAAVERIFARLDPAVGATLAGQIQAHATDVLSSSKTAARRLMEDLRYQVDTANRAVDARRRRARALADQLIGCPGSEADELRTALVGAEDDPDPDWPSLERAVARVVEEATAAALQEYAARALRESLEAVGCFVEEGFDNLLAQERMAHVRRPGWDDVAVRVRLRPDEEDRGAVHFNLIGPADGTTEAAVVEHEWCATVDAVVEELARRRIGLSITARTEEGTTELQRVDATRFPFERGQTAPERSRRADERQAGRRSREAR